MQKTDKATRIYFEGSGVHDLSHDNTPLFLYGVPFSKFSGQSRTMKSLSLRRVIDLLPRRHVQLENEISICRPSAKRNGKYSKITWETVDLAVSKTHWINT